MAQIREVRDATPTDPLRVVVHFWETYEHNKDLAERKYAPAFHNATNQEVYTTRYLEKEAPASWTPIEDEFPASQIVSPNCFKLTSDKKLPRQVIMDLLPLLSVQVVALPPCKCGSPQ